MHNKTIIDTRVHNPCYLKEYSNNETNILGIGDYDTCYQLLQNIVSQNNKMTDQRNEGSVLYYNIRFSWDKSLDISE
jgi:hypothetical protein